MLAAFGVARDNAKMPDDGVCKIEIALLGPFAEPPGRWRWGVRGHDSSGPNPESRMKYVKIIGDKEKAAESIRFDFLGLYRPAVILGNPIRRASAAT